jgi:FAD dependent oxidoreductase
MGRDIVIFPRRSDRPAMLIGSAGPSRNLVTIQLHADLVVIGGGLAGVCAAITAARKGIKVVLIQDRPVLGGNGSSEVRLWTLGATCHMGSNNRWAREGGVIDEMLVENLYRNPEGNPLIFDTVILEKVIEEPNITLLLNTCVFEVDKDPMDADRIQAVRAYCSQNETLYECQAPLFCDASGDGVVGFLSGAAFRMGAESKEEFDEAFAPTGEFGGLLGDSIYFYSKDAGRSIKFVPPSFALKDIPGSIPRYRSFNAKEDGCRLWWIEWGGRLDTVHEAERIKWELWRIVYGVWDYIKNSGNFPEAENLTLEWVGQIPGKRESRRFEGDYMLRQHDVVHRPHHEDAVAFGGWSIDLHPADGVFAKVAGSHHLHSKGIYQIPYRCLYSRNIKNLFLSGRIISASHVAFGTTRVMATCAHGAQAVGMAAALCRQWNCLPREIAAPEKMKVLHRELLRTGHHIPGFRLEDPDDRAQEATVFASSTLEITALPADGPSYRLEKSIAQMTPFSAGPAPRITAILDVDGPTELVVELRASSGAHHTPDVVLARKSFPLNHGAQQSVIVDFDVSINEPRYVFICFLQNEKVHVHCTEKRITGLMTVIYNRPENTSHIGGEDYEFWTPVRRPGGHNLALQFNPPVCAFSPENVHNGVYRPTQSCNAWAAAFDDPHPSLTLTWKEPQQIARIELFFDVDHDHALESVLWGHPERTSPFCVRRYRIVSDGDRTLYECSENHHARNIITLAEPITVLRLDIIFLEMNGHHSPPALFGVRCYP